MSIPRTADRKIRPTHPGEMLREDFLPDYGLTVATLADALSVSRQNVNALIRERRSVSVEMPLRLARLFRNSPEFWLNAQRAVDLWEAAREVRSEVARIKPLNVDSGQEETVYTRTIKKPAKAGKLKLSSARKAAREVAKSSAAKKSSARKRT